jgi:hypothetical protein
VNRPTERLSDRALNRALLARQGLLTPFERPLVEVVETIGAIQAQNWSAPPVALWARTRGFSTVDLHSALERRELIYGFGLRGTLHVVSASQFPSYAAVVEASGATAWQRTKAPPPPEMDQLRVDLLAHAAEPRAPAELVEFIEDWIASRRPALDPAELQIQRMASWRALLRWPALVRAPTGGAWARRPPLAQTAAPLPPARWPAPPEALGNLCRWHLQAFGPAGAEDVAAWIGWKAPLVRAALDAMDLERYEDERGRPLYDLPGAPRPDPQTPAAPRLLPWFDSVILAYAPQNRTRILPDEYRDRLYQRANLQWLPAILVDGMVAGTWSRPGGLVPFKKFPAAVTIALERLLAECPA